MASRISGRLEKIRLGACVHGHPLTGGLLGQEQYLGVGSHEHRHLRPWTRAAVGGAQRSRNGVGFGPVVAMTGDRRWGPRGSGRHQGRLIGQHGAGAAEDLGARAVILHELDRAGAGEVGLELIEVGGVGAIPTVDRLPAVADDTEAGSVTHEELQQRELERVDVLELVDEDMAEAPTEGLGRGAVLLEQAPAANEDVVEVDQAAL